MACCAAAIFILLNIGYAFRRLLIPLLGAAGRNEKPNLAVTWSLSAPNAEQRPPKLTSTAPRWPFRTIGLMAALAFASGLGMGLAIPEAGASALTVYRFETLTRSSICTQFRGALASIQQMATALRGSK